MTGENGWVDLDDPEGVLPEPLRTSARRRRRLMKVGGWIVFALVMVLIVMVDIAGFFVKVWAYGSTYRDVFR